MKSSLSEKAASKLAAHSFVMLARSAPSAAGPKPPDTLKPDMAVRLIVALPRCDRAVERKPDVYVPARKQWTGCFEWLMQREWYSGAFYMVQAMFWCVLDSASDAKRAGTQSKRRRGETISRCCAKHASCHHHP